MKNKQEDIKEAGNRLVGGLIGIAASELEMTPSKLTKIIGAVNIIELLEEHDKIISQALDTAFKEWKQEVKTKVIGKDDNEGDGWDIFFSDEAKCCPGDDIAFARNQLRTQQRLKLQELGE